MTSTEVLARETQLVFTNTPGWSPVGKTLQKWEGSIRTSTGSFEFEVFLPEYFPNVPPVVQCKTPASHPNFDKDNFVKMRILENWRAEFHLYQVINALKGLITRVPPIFERPSRKDLVSERDRVQIPSSTAQVPSSKQAVSTQPQISTAEVSALRDELKRLKGEMTEQEEELARVRARRAFGIETGTDDTSRPSEPETVPISGTEGHNQLIELESEHVALSELLAALHEKYSSGEASVYDFARLYKKYSRDLYLIKKKLEYMKQQ